MGMNRNFPMMCEPYPSMLSLRVIHRVICERVSLLSHKESNPSHNMKGNCFYCSIIIKMTSCDLLKEPCRFKIVLHVRNIPFEILIHNSFYSTFWTDLKVCNGRLQIEKCNQPFWALFLGLDNPN